MLNKAILCLGSNFDKERNMECAVNLLRTRFNSVRFSKPMVTEPINCISNKCFLNQVAILYTDSDVEQLISILKDFEKKIGRRPEDKKKGIIPIDIDLLQYNDQLLKKDDLMRYYVKSGIKDLIVQS